MIFIIEDNEVMARCLAEAARKGLRGKKREEGGASRIAGKTEVKADNVRIYHNAYEAMEGLVDGVPELIFLDILLDGVDGFTFLHEIMSYEDTAKIPVVLVTSLAVKGDLSTYGVVGVLNKETMTPKEIEVYVRKYTK